MSTRNAIIVADLGFGDAGKGSIVDAVVRQTNAKVIVRYNGACQASHRVVTTDNRQHIFSQFGSGMFVPDTETFLSRFMLVDPIAMMREEEYLRRVKIESAFERTMIDEEAVVITPFHQAANRIREIARGEGRHGSCGRGVGEAVADSRDSAMTLRICDLKSGVRALTEKLRFIQGAKYAQIAMLISGYPSSRYAQVFFEGVNDIVGAYREFVANATIVTSDFLSTLLHKRSAVFEGAQGALLDQRRGFTPYTTWSDTTFANAITLVNEASYQGKIVKIGVIRGYATRHGQGPLPTEDSSILSVLTNEHNTANEWQGPFRTGWLDIILLRHAVRICGGADCLAVNHLDHLLRLSNGWKVAEGYELTGVITPRWLFELDGNLVKQIAPTPDRELLLSAVLMSGHTVPQYRHFNGDQAEYLHYIERELKTPIAITSHGPTAADKQFLSNWQNIVE